MVEVPDSFDSYAMVLLRKAPDAPELSEAEAGDLQRRHLANIMSLIQSGEAYAGGPLLEQSDPSLVGLILFAVPIDEARGLAEEDPAVRAGQLVVETFTWWMPPGRLNLTE
jgi:hypothetical protein